MKRQGRKAAGLVRAGAKRLPGRRFPPEGLGLDARGRHVPIRRNSGSQPQAVIESNARGIVTRRAKTPLPDFNFRGGFVRPPTIERLRRSRGRVEPGRRSRRAQMQAIWSPSHCGDGQADDGKPVWPDGKLGSCAREPLLDPSNDSSTLRLGLQAQASVPTTRSHAVLF